MHTTTTAVVKDNHIIDVGRILACQLHGVTIAGDNGIHDYRSTDGYELLFPGPVDRVNDARDHGGFLMRMVNEAAWYRAATPDEFLTEGHTA